MGREWSSGQVGGRGVISTRDGVLPVPELDNPLGGALPGSMQDGERCRAHHTGGRGYLYTCRCWLVCRGRRLGLNTSCQRPAR